VATTGETDGVRAEGDPQAGLPDTHPVAASGDTWLDYTQAAGFVGIATVLAVLLRPHLAATNLAMVYLLAVVVSAVRCSRAASVVASFLSVATFDFFCVPPYYTFVVAEYEYLITFAVMLVVALVISSQTARIRAEGALASAREARTKALYRLSSQLAPHTRAFEAAMTATEVAEEVFDARVVIFLPEEGRISFHRRTSEVPLLSSSEEKAAQWCFETARKAGKGTAHFPESKAQYLPLKGASRVVGVMAVLPEAAPSIHQQRPLEERLPEQHLLSLFASQTATAIERIQSHDAAESARVRARTEEMRSSLLSAVSHDVRTPLATITGAATTLRSQASKLAPEVRAELLDSISEEAERLSRLVGNILDMTRLESGIELRRDVYPLEEIAGSALQRTEAQLAGREVTVDLPADLPLVSVDDVLIGQVLVNLLENAAKYTPPGSPIEVSARAKRDGLHLEVRDRGPGFAPGDETRIFEKFYRGVSRAGSGPGKGAGYGSSGEGTSGNGAGATASAANRNARGAGLGLPICKAIVETHRGTIAAWNRDGGGAVFHILLPLGGAS